MNIIAQSGATVNINISAEKFQAIKKHAKAAAKREERKRENRKDTFAKWQDHHTRSVRIAAKLAEIGYEKRSIRMKYCGTHLEFAQCHDCGNLAITQATLCRDRLCPTCAWRLSLKRYALMGGVMQALYDAYPEYYYSLVTLTVKNAEPHELRSTLDRMQEAWRSTINQRWAKEKFAGWARSIEITYNVKTHTFHPHYHIIMMTPDFDSPFDGVREWLRQCARQGIEAVFKAQNVAMITPEDHTAGESLAKSICEAYKYTIKSDSLEEMPLAHFKAYADAVDGKRLISMGGKIKEMAKAMEADRLDELAPEDENEQAQICTHCRSTELDKITLEWSWRQGRYFATVDAADATTAAETEATIQERIETADSIKGKEMPSL